jgi:hypothetical protein
MTYYAAVNIYATENSIGFANTWEVLAFINRRTRDAFVSGRTDLATRAIRKNEITKYSRTWNTQSNDYTRPKPFSGQYWGIVDDHPEWSATGRPNGYIGQVEVVDPNGYSQVVARLYR